MYELVIVGGGPAGVSAGVYAARKKLKTLLITESWGGQSTESVGIENWIGTPIVSGADFAKMLEGHVRKYEGEDLEIKMGKVVSVAKEGEIFKIGLESGEKFDSKTVLVTTGSTRRKLDIPGAKEFENKGITYCASCDGPLFAGMDVAVVGGGNAGLESAAQLLAYAKSVTLITRSKLKADPTTIERVLQSPKMRVIENTTPVEIKGDKFVTAMIYRSGDTQSNEELSVSGIFVEIGLVPTTWFLEGVVDMNKYKQIVVDPRSQRTSVSGIWAAGDSTDGLYHQNNIAAGDAVKALEDIYLHLRA